MDLTKRLYMVMGGKKECAHMMFVTSNLLKAQDFVKKYNSSMDEDTHTYDIYHAYVQEILDYVPCLQSDYYECSTIVYAIHADKDMNINEEDIIGLPIHDYIDFRMNEFESLGNDDPEELLEILLETRNLVNRTKRGFTVLIVVVSKGSEPCVDQYVTEDGIEPDLKANLIYKAKQLLKNMEIGK